MMKNETEASEINELIQGYDGIMYNPILDEYLNYSDFLNYGFWDKYILNQKQASENLMEKLLDLISEKKETILDVACGKGGTTSYLLKYYSPENITAINISEKQLETARANVSGCMFLRMDAAELEFDDNKFDNIICVEAAFHFNTREIFFKEAYRVLKPGGYLVLSDILMNREAERRRKYRTEKNYVKDPEEYKKIMNQTGFNNVEIVDVTESCWEGHFWNVVNYLNEKFFSKQCDGCQLYKQLERTYRVVPDIEYYILASAQKGMANN